MTESANDPKTAFRDLVAEADSYLRLGAAGEAEGELSFSNDQTMSRGENLRQAAMADWISRRRREAPGWQTEANIYMEQMATNVPILGVADRQLSYAASAAPGSPGAIENQALLAEIRDYLKDISQTNANVDRTTRSKVTTRQE